MNMEYVRSPEAVVWFCLISIVYLFLVVVVVLSSRLHDLRLIGLGLLTAVAAVGYSAGVFGGALVVGPMMMKLAFLLILGGIVTRVLADSSAAGPSDRGANP